MWANVDDAFWAHRKVLALMEHPDGLAAIGLWTLALGWARHQEANGSHGTPGQVPSAMVYRLAGEQGPHLAALLVQQARPPGYDHGLWDECPAGGWLFHDFAFWQQLEQWQAKRDQAKRAARKRWGQDGPGLFDAGADASADAGADADASPDAHAGADADAMPTTPHPNTREANASLDAHLATASFDAFWGAYPRKVGKRKAQQEWELALRQRRATPEVIVAGAMRYRDDPHRVAQYTKHPSTWLHQDCWGDDPMPSRGGRGRSGDEEFTDGLRRAAELQQQERGTR